MNRPLRVVVLHNQVAATGRPDELDTLVQSSAVQKALAELEYDVEPIECTLDFNNVRRRLVAARCDVVFNLVETLADTDRLGYLAAGLLDGLGIPFTGSPTDALLITVDKLLTKHRLAQLGLPVVPSFTPDQLAGAGDALAAQPEFPLTYIVKTLAEHGSFGIDAGALSHCFQLDDLRRHLAQREDHLNRACFAEPFIAGREFNVAMLARLDSHSHEPEVLPIGEIDFAGLPASAPKIVDYHAKWTPDSVEYNHTPRHFDLPPADQSLIERLSELSLACWREFRLAGHVRVDFRVDQKGNPFILEINANPCLAPDAGFAGIIEEARISYCDAIDRIVATALRGPAREVYRANKRRLTTR